MVFGTRQPRLGKKLNGWNSRCLVTLTGRTHREEASTDTTSFDFVATIRYQRLNWLKQILRKGPGNHLKEVATTITLKGDGTCPEGSLLSFMDAPAHDDTAHLCSLAGNEKGWAKHGARHFPRMCQRDQDDQNGQRGQRDRRRRRRR